MEASKQKSRFPCPKCGNQLRVLPDQRGTSVRCPKCNAAFVIGGSRKGAKPAAEAVSPAAGARAEGELDDSYLPEIPLKRSTIVPEEPAPLVPAKPAIVPEEPRPMMPDEPSSIAPPGEDELRPYGGDESSYEVDWSTVEKTEPVEVEASVAPSSAREDEYLESAWARGLVRELDYPDPPRWTFFSGVFTYPWRGVNLTRWTAMSFGLSLAGVLSLQTLYFMGLLGGELTNMAVQGVVLALFAIGVSLAALSFATTSCQAAIQDTADGHDLPQDASLPDWDQWVFTFLGWLSLWAAAGAIGFPLSLVIGPAAFLITSSILFPVLLLSSMEADSYLLPFSPPVLRTLGYYLHGWLMFYLLSTAMFVAWIVAFDAAFPHAPYLTVLLTGPALAAMMLVYSRLLGRLAWRASGAPAAAVEKSGDTAPRAAAAQGRSPQRAKRKRRRSIRIEIPDEAAAPDDRPDPPPRINFHLRP